MLTNLGNNNLQQKQCWENYVCSLLVISSVISCLWSVFTLYFLLKITFVQECEWALIPNVLKPLPAEHLFLMNTKWSFLALQFKMLILKNNKKKWGGRISNFLWKEKVIVGKPETELWNPFNETGIKYPGRLDPFLAQYTTYSFQRKRIFLVLVQSSPFSIPRSGETDAFV